MNERFTSRKEIQMNSGEHQSHVEKSVPLIYRLQRWFFAASIVLGIAATIVMVATNPGYYTLQNGEAAWLAAFAAANDLMIQTHLISSVIAFYLLPLGMLVMAWLAMRRSPWLASIGALLIVIGMLPLPAFAEQAALNHDIASMGSNSLLVSLALRNNSDWVMSYYNIVDVPGIVFGPALIGLALWRSRAIPVWAAVLVTASRLLVFLFPLFPSLPGEYIQLPSCVLLFIGSIPAALAVLRMPHSEGLKTVDKKAPASPLKA
jgi:hypothetical protein